MTNTNATPATVGTLALRWHVAQDFGQCHTSCGTCPACLAWDAMTDLRALMAERDRLRATLDEIAGHLRGRCEPGTTAMHCYNVATRALANREGVKP